MSAREYYEFIASEYLDDPFEVAFAPYPVDHEIEVRNVFVDTEEELIRRLNTIEFCACVDWTPRTNWAPARRTP